MYDAIGKYALIRGWLSFKFEHPKMHGVLGDGAYSRPGVYERKYEI